MYFVARTYFRHMYDTYSGWALLGILFIATCVDFWLVDVAISMSRRGRDAIGILALVGYTIAWLVAFWIVLLGPAALLLLRCAPGTDDFLPAICPNGIP
jgi:hypothetical protein